MSIDVVIRELEPGLAEDYLQFFDSDAFADNPAWASCYCRYYQFCADKKPWDECTAADNRESMRERIMNGDAHGLLAYVEGRPVAWCQAALPAALPSLERFLKHRLTEPSRTGIISCFAIAPPFRGQGIARRLLAAACDGFARKGLAFAEAYPARGARNAADHFPGPLSLYLDEGFTRVAELEHRFVVRKPLRVSVSSMKASNAPSAR
jgi:GNAT superfamily N-acetyltransferase